MDYSHRKAITENISILTKIQNFHSLREYLVAAGVFTQFMVDEILAGDGDTTEIDTAPDQALRLFLKIHTRGPDAFSHLVNGLIKSGNETLAQKLLQSSSVSLSTCDDVETRRTYIDTDTDPQVDVDEVDSCGIIYHDNHESYEPPAVKRPRISFQDVLTNEENDLSEDEQLSVDYEGCDSEECSDVQDCINNSLNSAAVITMTSSDEGFKFTVQPAVKFYNEVENLSECYPMTSDPRGIALIVNNIDFLGDPSEKRNGAENDSENLKTLLEQMGYEVIVETNITKKALLDRENGILTTFINKLSASKVDSCLVSLNSHGFDRDWIKMSDPPKSDERSTSVDFVTDILPRFNNRQFPAFHGKPKIFLINACRGNNFNRGVQKSIDLINRTQYDGHCNNSPSETIGSEFSDFLILRSTIPEYVSLRDPDKGTWFIQCVCKAFSQYACSHDFFGLKRKINELMEEYIDEESRDKQSCHYEEIGMTKLLYFNPCLR